MEKVKQYLLENANELKEVVQELNSWNGCLDQFNVYSNDEEFFDMFFEGKPMEAVRASHYGEYHFTDEFVRFNGYGNLESLSEWALENEMRDSIDEIVDLLIDNSGSIYISNELEELLEENEEEEE